MKFAIKHRFLSLSFPKHWQINLSYFLGPSTCINLHSFGVSFMVYQNTCAGATICAETFSRLELLHAQLKTADNNLIHTFLSCVDTRSTVILESYGITTHYSPIYHKSLYYFDLRFRSILSRAQSP